MILSITSLKIASLFHLFRVWPYSFRCVMQLKRNSKCIAFKTIGFGNPSYTMTLWNNEVEILEYFSSGAHAKAMKEASKWAEEIRSIRVDRDSLTEWKEAKVLIANQGKSLPKRNLGYTSSISPRTLIRIIPNSYYAASGNRAVLKSSIMERQFFQVVRIIKNMEIL